MLAVRVNGQPIKRWTDGGQTVGSRSLAVQQSFVTFVSRLDGGQDGRVDRLGTTESISCLHLVVRQTVAITVMSDRGIIARHVNHTRNTHMLLTAGLLREFE